MQYFLFRFQSKVGITDSKKLEITIFGTAYVTRIIPVVEGLNLEVIWTNLEQISGFLHKEGYDLIDN